MTLMEEHCLMRCLSVSHCTYGNTNFGFDFDARKQSQFRFQPKLKNPVLVDFYTVTMCIDQAGLLLQLHDWKVVATGG